MPRTLCPLCAPCLLVGTPPMPREESDYGLDASHVSSRLGTGTPDVTFRLPCGGADKAWGWIGLHGLSMPREGRGYSTPARFRSNNVSLADAGRGRLKRESVRFDGWAWLRSWADGRTFPSCWKGGYSQTVTPLRARNSEEGSSGAGSRCRRNVSRGKFCRFRSAEVRALLLQASRT